MDLVAYSAKKEKVSNGKKWRGLWFSIPSDNICRVHITFDRAFVGWRHMGQIYRQVWICCEHRMLGK
tara:strand:- start:202 stop:402 length:201 start_codon:yes stop_codon:yes gene_type:complete